jgi:hypothetical protein
MQISNAKTRVKGFQSLIRQNIRLATSIWRDEFSHREIPELKRISVDLGLSVGSGEVLLLAGKWYVTHSGLLRVAQRKRCLGIRTAVQERLCDPIANRWVFKALTKKRSSAFAASCEFPAPR